jgi:hypothetical protein
MNGRFKYVIVPGPIGNWAVLIPPCVEHCDAVKAGKAISAGFCVIENGHVTVDGFSASLDLHSRPEDVKIIKLSLAQAASAKKSHDASKSDVGGNPQP